MTDTLRVPVDEVPVLIVGGSLVGLTLAALLAKHGLNGCLTIEKHSSTAIHPRATMMQPRTMQVFRELGLYERMQAESLKYYDANTCIIGIASLAGKVLYHYMDDVNEGIEEISATKRVFLTQQALEPLLRARAKDLGAELRFSTELVDFTQDGDGVTATIRETETNTCRRVRAKYLVGADGFRSFVRNKLGIQTRGPGLLSRALTIYFQIKDKEALAKLPNAHYSGVIYVDNETLRAFFRFDRDKKESFLVINSAGPQGTEESRFPADTMTMAKAEMYLRAAIGADVEFEILQLSTWEAIADVPDLICDGRVLLAGDAAHRMPPSGGFGGNTGVQDAHNLAWKLAYVLQGKASDSLVQESYQAERMPVARQTVSQAVFHYVSRTEPGLKSLVQKHELTEVPDVELELAYRYYSNAVCSESGGGPITEDPKSAVAKPGSVAHHVLVEVEGSLDRVAISEFLGKAFVLFTGLEDTSWGKAARTLNAKENGFPEVQVQQVILDRNNDFAKKYGISPSGAVLVRPDGFVAWTATAAPEDRASANKTFREQMIGLLW